MCSNRFRFFLEELLLKNWKSPSLSGKLQPSHLPPKLPRHGAALPNRFTNRKGGYKHRDIRMTQNFKIDLVRVDCRCGIGMHFVGRKYTTKGCTDLCSSLSPTNMWSTGTCSLPQKKMWANKCWEWNTIVLKAKLCLILVSAHAAGRPVSYGNPETWIKNACIWKFVIWNVSTCFQHVSKIPSNHFISAYLPCQCFKQKSHQIILHQPCHVNPWNTPASKTRTYSSFVATTALRTSRSKSSRCTSSKPLLRAISKPTPVTGDEHLEADWRWKTSWMSSIIWTVYKIT